MMESIKCIIIEDEPIASDIMQDYIQNIPQLELIECFSDALFAIDFLRSNKVDLIFLDLHLPKLSGFDFLKSLKTPPKIIVTTAYHKYALEGYEFNIVDYLVKPIEFSRLVQAVNRLDIHKDLKKNEPSSISNKDEPIQFFNVNKKMVKVFLKDIYYIESLKEYVKIHLVNSHIITQYQIGEIEKALDSIDLIRIHRSYLVAKSKIEAYTSSSIELNGKELPIGRTYKNDVLRMLE
jgi:DNA-binding LytR/AlgR family response regulator